MKRAAILALALAALGAPACGKKDEQKPAPTVASGSAPAGSDMAAAGSAGSAAAAGSAGSAAAAGSAGSAAAAEVDVPTEVDFEGDAKAKIDEKNVEAKLKAVEQELSR